MPGSSPGESLVSHWNSQRFDQTQNCADLPQITLSFTAFRWHLAALSTRSTIKCLTTRRHLNTKKTAHSHIQLRSENYPLFQAPLRLTFVNLCHQKDRSHIKYDSFNLESHFWCRQLHKGELTLIFFHCFYMIWKNSGAGIEPISSAWKAEVIAIIRCPHMVSTTGIELVTY